MQHKSRGGLLIILQDKTNSEHENYVIEECLFVYLFCTLPVAMESHVCSIVQRKVLAWNAVVALEAIFLFSNLCALNGSKLGFSIHIVHKFRHGV